MASEHEELLRSIAEKDLRQLFPEARIIHELVLEQSTCRIDLAAVTANHICLVEIKSKKDNTKRLKDQIRHAEMVTPDIMIYADNYHLGAIEMLLGYVSFPIRTFTDGVLVPDRFNRHMRRKDLLATGNAKVNTRRILRLLWREELILIGKKTGFSRANNRHDIIEDLIERMTGEQIRKAVCHALRIRDFARADAPIAPKT